MSEFSVSLLFNDQNVIKLNLKVDLIIAIDSFPFHNISKSWLYGGRMVAMWWPWWPYVVAVSWPFIGRILAVWCRNVVWWPLAVPNLTISPLKVSYIRLFNSPLNSKFLSYSCLSVMNFLRERQKT